VVEQAFRPVEGGGRPSTNGGTHIRLFVKKFVDGMA